jgi:hypothetical protein
MQTLFVLFAKVGDRTELKSLYVTQTTVRQRGKIKIDLGNSYFWIYFTPSSQKWAEMELSVVWLGYGLDNRGFLVRFPVVSRYFSLLKKNR